MNGGDSNIEKVEKRKLADSPTENEEVASKIMKQDDSNLLEPRITASSNNTNNSQPRSSDDASREEAQQEAQTVESNVHTKEVENGVKTEDRSRSCPYLDTINRKLKQLKATFTQRKLKM